MSTGVRVGVLGPLEVSVDGRPLKVTTGRLRTVLAVLAIHAGRVVSVDRLATAIWTDEQPPANPAAAVQLYLTRLRTVLGAATITSNPSGYLLDLPTDQVDVLQFTRLLDSAATTADDPTHEHQQLTAALALWRGTPFEDIDSAWLHRSQTPQLVERHLTAVERRIDLDITAGHTDGLVAQLRELTAHHPLRESLWLRLLTVLDHAGRQAEALEQYETIRVRLAQELGTDPGPDLRQLHRNLLHGQTEQAAPAVAGQPAVPRQLPVAPPMFTGRITELTALDQATDMSTVVISAIDGMAGIGKTALAVHAAHRIADRYPDGQLFIDLHGYTQGVDPVEPGEALDRMLRALDIPGPQVPSGLDERAALYRTRLAGQRMLIVLDNAASETQVAPLLPGTPGCLVLVTTRQRLAGLDHTLTLSLDTLPVPDAVELLVRTAGVGRMEGEPPELLVALVELCGRLPLAIRIAAARLRSHPTWNVAHLVERLRDDSGPLRRGARQHRLAELEAGQRSVTAALDLSYQHVSPDEQHTYRLLGLHPGPDIDRYATAALLHSTVPHASRTLDQLLGAHLLLEPVAGRYRFHDLVRAHAAHTAARDQREPAARAALDRLLDYYRHTASAAIDAAYPHERERRLPVPPARTPGPDLGESVPATEWLDTELPNLLVAARFATEHGQPEYVLHLSTVLHRHLRTRGRYHDAETLYRQALAAARAVGHQAAELDALNGLGWVQRRQGQWAQAADHFGQALQGARSAGYRPAEVDALAGLGWVHLRRGQPDQAADHFRQALQVAGTSGYRAGELEALTGLSQIHLWQGRYESAVDHFGRALQVARSTGDSIGEWAALNGLGDVHRVQGRYEPATNYYQQALRIARATGHRVGELNALSGLGWIHRIQGRYEPAAENCRHALQIARAIGHRVGELTALTGLGDVYRRQGRYEPAADHYRQLLGLALQTGDRNFEFEARQGLGRLQQANGSPDAAVAHHAQALALASELGQPNDQARAHDGLAHAHHRLNEREQARRHWQQALDILTGLGVEHTDDEETTVAAIRAHLAALDQQEGR